MPVSVVVHSMEAKRQLNRTSLTILHLTHFISASASMFSLVAMSIDRYFAIETSNVRVKVTKHRCVAISVSTWILAGCFSLLYFIVGFTTFLMIFLNFSFLTCTVLIIITHVKTLRMIKKSGKELGRFACKDRYCDIMQEKKAAEREKKVTKTFVIMLIAFLWSILPAIILASILQFGIQIHCDIRHILRDMSYLIISALSAINPFIYAIRLKQFKKAIYLIIKCAEHGPTTRLHMSSVLELRQTGKSASLDRVESDQGLSSLARTSDS